MPESTAALVYAFSKEIAQPEAAQGSDENKWIALTIQAGNYFEDRIYYYLNQLNETPSVSDQGQHINARNLFAQGGGQGRFFTLWDKGQRYLYAADEIFKLGQEIDKAARQAAQNFYNNVKKKAEGKNVTFELTRGGNEIGDIIAKIAGEAINGEEIILEAKYQLSSTARVRWFELVSSKLFGQGEYETFLESHKDAYWAYKYSPSQWTLKMRADSTKAFLRQVAGGDANIWSYLLQKGKVNAGGSKQVAYARTNVNGQTVQADFKLSDLMDMKNIRLKSAAHHSSTMFFEDRTTGEEVGTFGMTDYSKPQNKEAGPTGASFSFAMYITQKVMNSYIN